MRLHAQFNVTRRLTCVAEHDETSEGCVFVVCSAHTLSCVQHIPVVLRDLLPLLLAADSPPL